MGAREIGIAVGLPAAVALVVLIAAAVAMGRGRAKGDEKERGAGLGWLVVVLVGGAMVMGAYAWQSQVGLWPRQAPQRFPFVAMAGVAIGLIVAFVARRRAIWAGVAAAVGGAVVAWALLSLVHSSYISVGARWGWIVSCGVIAGGQAWVLESAGARLPGWRGPALLAGVVGLAALGVTESFANGPLVLGGAGVVLGAAAVAGLIGRRVVWFPGPGAAGAVMVTGTLVFANWFGDSERWVMFALVAAGPMGAGVCLLPAVAKRGPNVRFAVAAVVVGVVLGLQAGRAVPPLIEAMRPSGEMDYEY